MSNDGIGVCTRSGLRSGVIEFVDLDIVCWVAYVERIGEMRIEYQTEGRQVAQTYHEHNLC